MAECRSNREIEHIILSYIALLLNSRNPLDKADAAEWCLKYFCGDLLMQK